MSDTRRRRKNKNAHPFRRAVLRGLAVVLPPLLTIVILLWIGKTIQQYVLEPVETVAQHAVVWYVNETYKAVPPGAVADAEDPRRFLLDGRPFVRLAGGQWIPQEVRQAVLADPGESVPETGRAYYQRYVQLTYLRRSIVIPFFLAGFILVLYLLGKFIAAGVGRFLWHSAERVIHRLPLIRSVYSSVKQVTDFFLSESEIEFTRVVAVEYPRRGVWSLGFVTGESLATVRTAAREPVLSVLMPTSPIPGTGFTITVRKSETIDLDIAIDEALQFVVSCGVVIPPTELEEEVNAQIAEALEKRHLRMDDAVPSGAAPNALPATDGPRPE